MKRAFIDANFIVRFLTGDPPELAEKALSLFNAVEQGELILIVAEIVVAETIWVLRSFYGYSPSEIARVLQDLLNHEGLESTDKSGLMLALNLFDEKNIDFADAILAVQMAREGVKEVFSFDHHFDRLPGLVRLEATG